MADRKRSRSLLECAYDLQTSDEALSLYRDWATSYDTDLVDPLGYVGPRRVADIAAARCRDLNAHILDVGCGTGLVGEREVDLRAIVEGTRGNQLNTVGGSSEHSDQRGNFKRYGDRGIIAELYIADKSLSI